MSRSLGYVALLALLVIVAALLAGPHLYPGRQGDWQSHPALIPPDGKSHRGDKRTPPIADQRVLDELSRRFRATKELSLDGKGAEDFEIRQEYFLRLLDHYLFEKNRLKGMTRVQVEAIFGPGSKCFDGTPGRLEWSAGRDSLCIDVKDGRVTQAMYVMGY
jgi:hypothetical protein